ncbi:MAG: cytochrome ubiquinol oxidase subunit I, partial [Roseiflexaceae bacterium]
PSSFQQVLHMTIASYVATGAAVAGIHAWMLLRDRTNTFHRHALAISLVVAGVSALLQPLSGHHSAQVVAEVQPIKLAAMEGQFKSEKCAPLRIGGIPNEATEQTRFALEIPCGLSILAFNDPNAEVKGLNTVPPADRPPVAIVHIAFQIMVAAGFALAGVGILTAFLAWRKRGLPDARWLLWLLVAASPLGFIAIEAGWTVTEVGRQPWVVYNILRTADAVTPMPGLIVPFVTFTLLYVFLAVIVVWLLWRQVVASPTIPAGAPSEETSHAVA